MSDKLYMNWDDYNKGIQYIKEKVQDLDNPTIITLYRGGLPMGTHLSNILDIPLNIIDFQSYDGFGKEATFIKKDSITSNQTIILVDDIFDIGLTIAKAVDLIGKEYPNNKVKIFTLFENSKNNHLHKNYKFSVDYVNSSNGEWVVFPWEI